MSFRAQKYLEMKFWLGNLLLLVVEYITSMYGANLTISMLSEESNIQGNVTMVNHSTPLSTNVTTALTTNVTTALTTNVTTTLTTNNTNGLTTNVTSLLTTNVTNASNHSQVNASSSYNLTTTQPNKTITATTTTTSTTKLMRIILTLNSNRDAKPTTTKPTTTKKKIAPKLSFKHRLNQDNQEFLTYVGELFKFDCSVDGDPQPYPNITWLKDDKPIKLASYRFLNYAVDLEKISVLILPNLLISDAGKYKCTANNGFSKPISTSLTLRIVERVSDLKPAISYFGPLDLRVKAGKDIALTCNGVHQKDAIPFIKWLRHKTINPMNVTNSTLPSTKFTSLILDRMSTHFEVINGTIVEHTSLQLNHCAESVLRLNSVSVRDTATYTCLVFNQVGYVQQSTTITVYELKLTSRELEELYVKKYGRENTLPIPLSVLVVLPLFVLILILIGCIYWNESQKRHRYMERKQLATQTSTAEKASSPTKIPAAICVIPEIAAPIYKTGGSVEYTHRKPSPISEDLRDEDVNDALLENDWDNINDDDEGKKSH